jgi:hypothetical protein
MKRPKPVYIYGLKDPRDDQIYYVGKTENPERRYREHLKDKKTNTKKTQWVAELRSAGLQPEMVVLTTTTRQEWEESEIYWIARGYEEGWPLVNLTKGGESGYWKPKMPNYNYMQSYVRPDLWDVFDALSIREKDRICLESAGVMADFYLPILDHKIATKQRVFQSLIDDCAVFLAMDKATALVEDISLYGRQHA